MPDFALPPGLRHALPPAVAAELRQALAAGCPADQAAEAARARLLALCPAMPFALAREVTADWAATLAAGQRRGA